MKDDHINVFFSDADGCYVADITNLKFCSVLGDSAEETVREVQEAKKAWLSAARKPRKPIPKPKYRPAIYQLAR